MAKKTAAPAWIVIPKSSPSDAAFGPDLFYEKTRRSVGAFRYLPLIYGEGNLKGNVIWISPERSEHVFTNKGNSYTAVVYCVEIALCEMLLQWGGAKGGYFIDLIAGRQEWNLPGGGTVTEDNSSHEDGSRLLIHHYGESVDDGASPYKYYIDQGLYLYYPFAGFSHRTKTENNPKDAESVAGMGRYIGMKRSNASTISADRYDEMEVRQKLLPGIVSMWWNRYLTFVDNGEKGYLNVNAGPYASTMPGIFRLTMLIAQFKDDANLPPETTFRVKNCWNKDFKGCFYRIILFDMLTRAGIDILDLGPETGANAIFGITDDHLNGNYYLNLVIEEQRTIRSVIEEIAQRVGAQVYYYDRFYIRDAIPDSIAPVATIDEKELISYTLGTQAPTEIPNLYKVFYKTRKNMTTSQKEVTILNEVVRSRGVDRIKNLDFSNYTDLDTALKQLSRVMKHESLPKRFGSLTTSLKRYNLRPGMVVTLHLPESMNADIDVMLTRRVIGDNDIAFDYVQISPISSYFSESQEPDPYGEIEIPEITEMSISEIRGSAYYGTDPAHVLTPIPSAALLSYFAANPGKYYRLELWRSDLVGGPFSLWISRPCDPDHRIMMARGKLRDSVSSTGRIKTYSDELDGILVKDVVGNLDAVIGDCKFLLRIDSEVIEADLVEASGSDYLFRAYTRASIGTDRAAHAADAVVRIFKRYPSLTDNFFGFDNLGIGINYHEIITDPADLDFYVKPMLVRMDNLAISDLDLTPAFHVQSLEIAKVPFKVGQIKAVRTGASVVFTWTPVSFDRDHNGAGLKMSSETVPGSFTWDGSFFYAYSGAFTTEINALTVTILKTGAFWFSVYQEIDGISGDTRVVNVGAADGIYYS